MNRADHLYRLPGVGISVNAADLNGFTRRAFLAPLDFLKTVFFAGYLLTLPAGLNLPETDVFFNSN